ncbi:MAG: hypothetical protein K5653_09500 [Clostridiales bacterium]|nr:hypothetical protein [Clostridiales bacterium]
MSYRRDLIKELYNMLNQVEVLDHDCGKLCGAACCTASKAGSEEEMGIYLLPGEEELLKGEDWLVIRESDASEHDLPESWTGKVYFARCKTPPICPRDMRPMQCRTFPLTPHLYEDGSLEMIYSDLELPYECPLIEEETPLNDEFVDTLYDAWARLIEDPLIRDLVRMDSEAREESFDELMEKLGL